MINGAKPRHVRQTPVTIRCERIAQQPDLPDCLFTRVIRLKARGLTTKEVALIVGEKAATVSGKLLEAIDWVQRGCPESERKNRWTCSLQPVAEAAAPAKPEISPEQAQVKSEVKIAPPQTEQPVKPRPAAVTVKSKKPGSLHSGAQKPHPRAKTALLPSAVLAQTPQKAADLHRRWKKQFYELLARGYSVKEAAAQLA